MNDFANLRRYPIQQPGSGAWQELVTTSRTALVSDGLVNLPEFLCEDALDAAIAEVSPAIREAAFTHRREHNIYFKSSVEGLNADHPALRRFSTVNHTVCADQIPASVILRLYEWPDFTRFLAAVTGKPALYVMDDPLARVNVMAYRSGDALSWHFDRSEFTTTLLLQSPDAGGDFEYFRDLRSDADPNHDGVAALLDGRLPVTQMPLEPGTLNIFRGKNTAHRVTPVGGERERVIAVFSYFERPGVAFSDEERLDFYGRTAG